MPPEIAGVNNCLILCCVKGGKSNTGWGTREAAGAVGRRQAGDQVSLSKSAGLPIARVLAPSSIRLISGQHRAAAKLNKGVNAALPFPGLTRPSAPGRLCLLSRFRLPYQRQQTFPISGIRGSMIPPDPP
jgi:hypothetical protein